MAVLIEAISVVVRSEPLLDRFGNDWERFKNEVPNQTLCADGEIVRVGFMVPIDVQRFVEGLERHGLQYLREGRSVDLVVVDQIRGPMVPCDWIEFGHVSVGSGRQNRVAVCRLKGSLATQVVMPEGWQFESSLSASHGFACSSLPESGLQNKLSRQAQCPRAGSKPKSRHRAPVSSHPCGRPA